MSKIKPGQHTFIAGRNGTGKTYLACEYLKNVPNVIVLDTKGYLAEDWKAEDVSLFHRLTDLSGFTKGRAIYQPIAEEMTKDYYNAFFKWIYDRKNCVVWVDEQMSLTEGSGDIPFYEKACLTRGRQRGISCYILTQRPKGIPLVCMSEAYHMFIFDLTLEDDRRRISEVSSSKLFLQTPTQYARGVLHTDQDFLFWYWNVKQDDPTIARLD